jgi:hypothetical protein
MIPPRGWKADSEKNQRIKILWYLPDIVIYEPRKRGVYDLLVPSGGTYKMVPSFPHERERSERTWGKSYIGSSSPISSMQYNAITISQWEERVHGSY